LDDETTRIALHPTVTDRIELTVQSWKSVLDRTALGFAQTQPPGLAEVSVLGPDYPPPADPDRLITVGCADGPTVTLGGRVFQTSVTATAAELLSGAPVAARVCGVGTVDLFPGRVDVIAAPTELFFVDRLRLDNPAVDPVPNPAVTGGQQLLVLPLSTNVRWTALP